MQAKCTMCGAVIRSRKSTKGTAQANLLRAIRKHCWKHHRNTMIRRIKQGKADSSENPSAQDLMEALLDGPRAAIAVYKRYTERQYQTMKKMMDAFSSVLPPEVVATWKAIEAFHDMRRG